MEGRGETSERRKGRRGEFVIVICRLTQSEG